ncbi:twin-arginine translocase TatA/TatE family subunit [bacterium]|nr:twin-arginine translocase TatA/TatE family subunit [bacterium]
MGGLSTWHWIIALVIILIIFGPDRLPQLARAVGKSMRELKDGMSGVGQEMQQAMKEPPKTTEPSTPAPSQTSEHEPEEPKNT